MKSGPQWYWCSALFSHIWKYSTREASLFLSGQIKQSTSVLWSVENLIWSGFISVPRQLSGSGSVPVVQIPVFAESYCSQDTSESWTNATWSLLFLPRWNHSFSIVRICVRSLWIVFKGFCTSSCHAASEPQSEHLYIAHARTFLIGLVQTININKHRQ